jgi:hypothetical protein
MIPASAAWEGMNTTSWEITVFGFPDFSWCPASENDTVKLQLDTDVQRSVLVVPWTFLISSVTSTNICCFIPNKNQ